MTKRNSYWFLIIYFHHKTTSRRKNSSLFLSFALLQIDYSFIFIKGGILIRLTVLKIWSILASVRVISFSMISIMLNEFISASISWFRRVWSYLTNYISAYTVLYSASMTLLAYVRKSILSWWTYLWWWYCWRYLLYIIVAYPVQICPPFEYYMIKSNQMAIRLSSVLMILFAKSNSNFGFFLAGDVSGLPFSFAVFIGE